MDRGLEVYQHFLEGDEKALDELIAMYRDPLTAFICGFTKDNDIAESIMIDVFVELIRHKGFKGKSSLKTYLFAIGRNKALRHLKSNRRDFISLDEVENYISNDEIFTEKLVEDERKELIHEAMDKLNPVYKEVIYLLYFEGMSYKEASLVLRKSSKQIANIAYRAKQSLKFHIEERMNTNEQNERRSS